MPRLSPFHGLVFDAAVAGPLDHVTAPPYDVISDRRRLELLRASPFSVVHLDLAEGSGDPAGSGSRYVRAARLLAGWEDHGALRRAEEPCYYAYEMTFANQGQRGFGATEGRVRGVICAMQIEDWGGAVLPHEHVMDGPVKDRLALLRATRTHLSPVYGIVDGGGELAELVRGAASKETPLRATDEDGVLHRMWALPGGAADLASLADEHLLIADGHHRYTTALHYRNERRRTDGAGRSDAVMTLVVDAAAEHLPVLPFHRVQVAGEAPPPSGDVMAGLAEVLDTLADDDLTVGTVSREARGDITYRVRRLGGEPPTVRALHDEVLDALVPPGSLRYLPDPTEADASLRRGDAVAVYLLPPTTPERIRAVVGRGERLPQKSTYFWPKPRTGMVMMPLDPPSRPLGAPADRAS